MKISLIVAALCAVSISGCGTLKRGTNDVLQVNTTPSGAQVQTTNGFSCDSTPCAIKMPRRSEFVATISKEGCRPVNVNVTNVLTEGAGNSAAGNVLLGGGGLVVDAATGAARELAPNPVNVNLEC